MMFRAVLFLVLASFAWSAQGHAFPSVDVSLPSFGPEASSAASDAVRTMTEAFSKSLRRLTTAVPEALHAHQFAPRQVTTAAPPSAACQTALSAVAAVTASAECQAANSLFNEIVGTFSAGSSLSGSTINSVCQKTSSAAMWQCTDKLTPSLRAAAAVCEPPQRDGAFAAAELRVRTVTMANQTICIRVDASPNSGYCYATLVDSNFFKQMLTGAGLFASLTDAAVRDFCSPCVFRLLSGLRAYNAFTPSEEQRAAAGFQLICTKNPSDSTQFCGSTLAGIVNVGSAPRSPDGAPFSDQQFATFCSPCGRAITSQITSLLPILSPDSSKSTIDSIAALKFLCTKDPSKSGYCMQTLMKDVTSVTSNFKPTQEQAMACATLSSGCTPACAKVFSDLLSPMGCCLGSIPLNSFTDGSSSNPFSACSLTLPAPCSMPTSRFSMRLTIDNLSFRWLSADAARTPLIKARLLADISTALSLQPEAITIGDLTASAKGGVVVSVTVSVDATLARGYQQSALSAVSSGSLSLPQTASLPSESKLDSTAGVGVSSTSTVSDMSSSPFLKSNFLTLASLFVGLATVIALW